MTLELAVSAILPKIALSSLCLLINHHDFSCFQKANSPNFSNHLPTLSSSGYETKTTTLLF